VKRQESPRLQAGEYVNNVTFAKNRKNIPVDQDKNHEIQGKNKKAWRVNQAQLHSG
jgi:hypothetical protein